VTPSDDLREVLFGGLVWYEALSEAETSTWGAWRTAKGTEAACWIPLLNAGFAFAAEHDLVDRYRIKFAGISLGDLRLDKAERERRVSTFPIWEIANELIVARYLEKVLEWTFREHEPEGRGSRRGDWEFVTRSGRHVFVEVKSLQEAEPRDTGVYSRPDYGPRLRSVLKGAYAQLPDDGRATLVVLVGKELMRIPFGIMHGDLFQALYGRIQVRFRVMPYDPTSVRMGPSFRDMFVHGTKHRRLGCVAGLAAVGIDVPAVRAYAIHNPYAYPAVKLLPEDLRNADQFVIDDDGYGQTVDGIDRNDVWPRMARASSFA
jgi:hypothetical protein